MTCLFCEKAKESTHLKDFENSYAIFDEFPVSPGHVLLISKEHIPDWFSAAETIQQEFTKATNELKKTLDQKFHPQAYNIGLNCGRAAGQTLMHLHLHLIPRYEGDMENPRGGVRGVIPGKQNY
ncbi:HIT family protein [Chlamydiales bacterium]|nr:HIT family protein [Chlamydiales bacterium]